MSRIALFMAMLLVLWAPVRTVLAAPESTASNTTTLNRLTDFVRKVQERSPQIRALDAALDAATARFDAAGKPLYNPELELDAENPGSRTIGISQTLDWAGKRDARSKVADHALRAAAAEVELARQALAAELLKGLAEYTTAADLNRLANEKMKLMQQFADIAQQRQAAGDLDQVEFELARLAALEASLEAASLATRLGEADSKLVALTSLTETSWPDLPMAPPLSPAISTDTATLLQQHPALRIRQFTAESAKATTELRRREARPDPAVGLRLGRDADDTLTGLTFSMPLLIRNRFQAEIAEASALASQARLDMAATRIELASNIDASRTRYQLARSTWDHWQQQGETLLQRRGKLLTRLWQTGELGTTDYLVQLRQTLDTRSAAAELRGKLWRSWADWQQASGTILQSLQIATPNTDTE